MSRMARKRYEDPAERKKTSESIRLFNDEEEYALYMMNKNGETMDSLGNKYGCHRMTIFNICKRVRSRLQKEKENGKGHFQVRRE